MGYGDQPVKLTLEVEVETEHDRRDVIRWFDAYMLEAIRMAIEKIVGTGISRVRLIRR